MLSPEYRIAQRIADLQITGAFLSALYGCSNSRLAMALRGDLPFKNEDAEGLLDLTQRLIELRDAFRPIPLKLTNAVEVRALLDVMKRQFIEPEELRRALSTVFNSSGTESFVK